MLGEPHESVLGSAAGSFRRLVSNRIGSAIALRDRGALDGADLRPVRLVPFRPETKDTRAAGGGRIFTDPQFTLDNYEQILGGATSTNLARTSRTPSSSPCRRHWHPSILAIMASYAFSVLEWKGRDIVFVVVFALQIVPLQMALIAAAARLLWHGDRRCVPVPVTVGGAHRPLRVAAGDLPAAQLSCQKCRGISSRRLPDRRRGARLGVPAGDAAADAARDRELRDLPVPLGVERPARGSDLLRRISGPCSRSRPRWPR